MTMETLENVLSEHPFVKGLPERYLELLVGCCANARFEVGEIILREGEPAHQFFLIRQGKVVLEIYSPERGPMMVLTLGPGEALGWSWLFPPYRWKFDARAVEQTRAFVIEAECLRKKCEEDHDFGYEILKRFLHMVEERLEATRLQLMNVYETNT
jgi:CRP/FNR family transcriptional regulator, cyclic AMP receptor protein